MSGTLAVATQAPTVREAFQDFSTEYHTLRKAIAGSGHGEQIDKTHTAFNTLSSAIAGSKQVQSEVLRERATQIATTLDEAITKIEQEAPKKNSFDVEINMGTIIAEGLHESYQKLITPIKQAVAQLKTLLAA